MSRLAASSQSVYNFNEIFLNLYIDGFEQQKDVDDISEIRYKENPVHEFKNCTRKFLNCIKLD